MKKVIFAAVFILSVCVFARAQSDLRKINVRAVLVDKDLNQKPVPHLALVLAAADGNNPGNSLSAKTDFDGIAEFQAPPGKYRLTTPEGVDFQGRHFAWNMEITVNEDAWSWI
jgi:hypothetical protein